MTQADAVSAPWAGEERILDWEGCLNARDTGGLATPDGARIRRGALVRSDVLTRITPSGRRALIEHGVRTIVDVRTGVEVARDWHAYPFQDGSVTYLNIPFTSGSDERAWDEHKDRYHSARSREELNRIDIDEHSVGIAAIARAIAEAQEGGVLIHCHAGKDRTGMIVALMLSLCGVDDEAIADDYALTARNLEPLIVDWLEQMTDDEVERTRLRVLADPRREAMLDTLGYLRQRYGSAREYLLRAGVTAAQLDLISARLIDRTAATDG